MKNLKFTIILMVLFSAITQADPVGTRFSYQGQLQDNGTAISGSYTFQFLLYDSLTGGATIDIFDLTGVPVSNGLFAVELDFGDVPFVGEEQYLEIRVKEDTEPTMSILTPRQRINTVPYAIQSAFVENNASPWEDVTGGIGYTQNVKVGNLGTATGSMLTVDATAASPVRFKVSGSTKMIINTNGGTSIGNNTSAPDNGLRVEGISRLVGNTELSGDLQQDVENNGAIKAGVYLFCSDNPSINHSFNGVNSNDITTSVGADTGRCRINFPFVLDNRYFMAMYRSSSTATAERRLVTCNQTAVGSSTLECAVTNNSGTAVNSNINVMVY